MNRSLVLIPALIPALLAAGGTAFAGKPGHPRLHAPVSIEEARSRAAEGFASMDADGNGKLTPEELTMEALHSEEQRATMKAAMRERMFARLDDDGDGAVSAEEFAMRIERLARLDTDNDGVVSHDELRAGRRHMDSKRRRDG